MTKRNQPKNIKTTAAPDLLLSQAPVIPFARYKEMSAEALKEQLLQRVTGMSFGEKAEHGKMKEGLLRNIVEAPTEPEGKQHDALYKATVVLDVIEQVVAQNVKKALKGAHIMYQDNGQLFDALAAEGIAHERMSSHHASNKATKWDRGIQGGEIFRELLIGKTKDGKTWFQLERNSTKGGIGNFFRHMADFVVYKLTGKNVGQYGLSSHVDRDPINVVQAPPTETPDSPQETTRVSLRAGVALESTRASDEPSQASAAKLEAAVPDLQVERPNSEDATARQNTHKPEQTQQEPRAEVAPQAQAPQSDNGDKHEGQHKRRELHGGGRGEHKKSEGLGAAADGLQAALDGKHAEPKHSKKGDHDKNHGHRR